VSAACLAALRPMTAVPSGAASPFLSAATRAALAPGLKSPGRASRPGTGRGVMRTSRFRRSGPGSRRDRRRLCPGPAPEELTGHVTGLPPPPGGGPLPPSARPPRAGRPRRRRRHVPACSRAMSMPRRPVPAAETVRGERHDDPLSRPGAREREVLAHGGGPLAPGPSAGSRANEPASPPAAMDPVLGCGMRDPGGRRRPQARRAVSPRQ
jgi:hypothetical protein